MGFLKKKLSGIRKRLKCFSYGIFYLRNKDFKIPERFYINGGFKKLMFDNPASPGFIYEFNEICLEDCYGLHVLKNKLSAVNVIVDVGANQGLFSITARKYFPKTVITCYEPNKNLLPFLQVNMDALDAKLYFEAVTKEDCNIQLDFGATDLHTVTRKSAEGNVTGTAFRKIIERAGGRIDILKMDCEGAEWELFEDVESWQYVNSITMEYHLWAKPGSSAQDTILLLKQLGYAILSHKALSDTFGLLTMVRE